MTYTKYNRRKQYYSSHDPSTNRFERLLIQNGREKRISTVTNLNNDLNDLYKKLSNPYIDENDFSDLFHEFVDLNEMVRALRKENAALLQVCCILSAPDKKNYKGR